MSDPALAPLFGEVRAAVLERVAAARGEASADELEALNRLFPSAKASLLLVSGSLRSFQKLVAQRDDPGKEAELRALLRTLNRSLAALWPALFALDPEGA